MKNKIKFIAWLLQLILFYLLFFQKEWGFNTLIFSAIWVIQANFLFPRIYKYQSTLLSAAGLLASAIAIVLTGSILSKFIFSLALMVFHGMVLYKGFRNPVFPAVSFFFTISKNIFKFPFLITSLLPNSGSTKFRKRLKFVQLAIIPIIISIIFLSIYSDANLNLRRLVRNIRRELTHLLENILQFDFGDSLVFLLFSGLLLGSAIISINISKLKSLDNTWKINIPRNANTRWAYFLKHMIIGKNKILGLKYAYMQAVLILIPVNLILLVLNTFELVDLFKEVNLPAYRISSMVHQGTYTLIFSILLAIVILLALFEGNLNHYKKSKFLKILASIWLIQNIVLVGIICNYNFMYISDFGLTYKRIGVIVFLTATLFGLFCFFYKLRFNRSAYFLFNKSTFFIYIMAISLSFIDWDKQIIGFNLTRSNQELIDYRYVYSFSDKSLAFTNFLERTQNSSHNLENRVYEFLYNYENRKWYEWNYSDYKTYFQLKNQ